jgi:hypothetical protein
MTDTDKLVAQIHGDDDHDADFGQSEAAGHDAGRGDVLRAGNGRGDGPRAEFAHAEARLPTTGLLAARAKAVEARRIRHRRTARRGSLDRPRTESAPAHTALVLVAEGLQGGIHG